MPVGTFGKFMFFEYLESITFYSQESWPGDGYPVNPASRQIAMSLYYMHPKDVRGRAGADWLLTETDKQTAVELLAPVMPKRIFVVA
jgi:hypothetical protein